LFVVYQADTGAAKAAGKAGQRLVYSSSDAGEADMQRQFELLDDQLRAQVPPDRSIYLDHLDDPSGLWTQRITEFAAMARVFVVLDPARADYAITLVADRSAPEGVRLVAKPLR
jgi:hypothetical protein